MEKEKKSKTFGILSIIRIICLLIILVCIGIIIYRYFNLKEADKVIENVNSNISITDKNVEVNGATANLIETNIDSLKTINSDTVAYLKVNGTNINYPVVQGDDNSYYLKHSFNKSYSESGWIFLDYRNDVSKLNRNTIIYGHNMLNQTMFSNLTKLTNASFFNTESNKYINLDFEDKSTIWKIFSVYVTNPDTYYMSIGFSSSDEYSNFLNNIQSKSMYNFSESLTPDDKILTLSTCTNLNTKRLVVHAKLIYEEKK